jgi:hypothetical protein
MELTMKKKIVLLCKNVYFNLPCVKYSRACGYSYYTNVLGIYITPTDKEPKTPKWVKPWVWNLSNKVSAFLLNYMVKNKDVLIEYYYKNKK